LLVTFRNKVVMVTGANSGIGRSCVELLLAQGASVVAFDRAAAASDGAKSGANSGLVSIRGDVKSAKDIAAAANQAVTSFGRLDVGINCAGITGPLARIVDQADDAMDDVLAINVRGIFLSMKYQLQQMLRQGPGGAIVNAASVFSNRCMEAYGLYIASKHAVAGLTKTAAVEVATSGIRVNAVAPGPIKTPFIGQLTPEQEKAASSTVPMFRLGEPVEVARAILWLASEEASYLTGSILSIDGGMSTNAIPLPPTLA
jgi:NAD(P)-dependent dehydrogenase (short-subunit alcohol dehydrogenase family)